nr:lytic transglycosylase domain-containing protein [Schlegelella koreensis]
MALACAPQVHPETALAIATVESSLNPYAIGVVGGALVRQPRTGAEARATARALLAGGWNYSVGLGQINVANFARLGLTTHNAFDPCASLTAMQSVLGECYRRAMSDADPQTALRRALSCYYSGDFSTGVRHGYVRRVVGTALRVSPRPAPRPPRTSPHQELSS